MQIILMLQIEIICRDSYEWVHVMCAWWIPEVKIEDSKYIERITTDKIPVSALATSK